MELPRPSARRIYYLHPLLIGGLEGLDGHLTRVRDLGFDTVLIAPMFEPGADGDIYAPASAERSHPALGGGTVDGLVETFVRQAAAHGLDVLVDLALQRFAAEHPLVAAHPQAFAVRRIGASDAPVNPRRPAPLTGEARARLEDTNCAEPLAAFAVEQLQRWATLGVKGVRVLRPDGAAAEFWTGLIAAVRQSAPTFEFVAETEAVSRGAALALAGCGFDALTSSLAYWDGRARWFVEEYEGLRDVAPLLAEVEAPFGQRLAAQAVNPGQAALVIEQRLMLAAATGAGLLIPMGLEAAATAPLDARNGDPAAFRAALDSAPSGLAEAVRAANALSGELSRFAGEMRVLTGEGAAVTALLKANAADVRRATAALLVLVNPDLQNRATPQTDDLLSAAGGEFDVFARVDGGEAPFAPLRPAEVRLLLARRSTPISHPLRPGPTSAESAALAPRLVVEGISPRVEGGPYPVRRVVGETLEVQADVFGDGHEQLSAELQWRALDQAGWSCAPMVELGNDRWRASFPLERLGRYEFVVEGWLDVYAGFRRDYRKKRDAGVAQKVDVQEGHEFVKQACKRAKGELKTALKVLVDRLKTAASDEVRGEILLEDDVAALMRRADERPFRRRSEPQFVDAERLQARFASWYELFPRSMTDDPARHGTFDDVIARLPQVRAMGFDVLYFPPIHPIGRKNMKGKNNSLTPSDDDVGSPYAIGSDQGGHDAIHPELGDFEDFRRLIRAAAEHGLEIALDFAVQCSPDHPWLKEHPGWFDWRPDGSIKYAENPPKKYQDIVNVDFYKPDAVPALWMALRDIVLMWVGEGVKLFRVDNPHTKPLPFWEWLIREVHSVHPDTVFLAEAFTRPKVMYRLAKIGFSQSYTYFTWRHSKAEFIEYLTELTQTAPKEFFRPHFFVNTPDINPVFLQTSGRGGFLIRAALASLLSGLFGVYSGFELCEFEPLPGKEEYKDSEKYEIRVRPTRAPGDIVDEITRLNRIRKGHPALQTHLGVEFLPSWNDNVLVFAKTTPALDDVVVAAISLDPHGAQETHFELPLWRWGVSDEGPAEVEDLVWENRSTWWGKTQHVRLDPNAPYAIWSLRVTPKAS
jgi:starch synthase (maltosyl-transferring)